MNNLVRMVSPFAMISDPYVGRGSGETPREWQDRLRLARAKAGGQQQPKPAEPAPLPARDLAMEAHRREVAELNASIEVGQHQKKLLQSQLEVAELEKKLAKQAAKEKGFSGHIRFAGGTFNAFKRSK